MAESDKSSLILNMRKPWEDNENGVWLASTVCLQRNLEKFKFPGKLDTDRRKQIVSLLSKDLLSTDMLQAPQLIKGEEMSPVEKEYLVEHFLSSQNFIQAHTGEAFIIDQSGQFLATFNLRDHLHLQFISTMGKLRTHGANL